MPILCTEQYLGSTFLPYSTTTHSGSKVTLLVDWSANPGVEWSVRNPTEGDEMAENCWWQLNCGKLSPLKDGRVSLDLQEEQGGGMAQTPRGESDETDEMRKVTITMPKWMHDDLRQRARRRGITVTELMRRSVALDRVLHEDPDNQILIRRGDELERVVLAG